MTDLRLILARDLRSVRDMFRDLRTQAYFKSNDASHIPGGDAMVMLGPGANVEAFGYAQISTYFGRTPGWVEEPLPDDLEPPLSFLASWSDIVRSERGQPTDLKATIDRETDYLLSSIDWMLSNDEHGEPRFIQVEDFADGLGKVRRAMENVLKAGDRAEFTRVYCIAEKCETHPRLMKLWGAQVRWDRYRCPACRTEYNPEQFKMARSENLYSEGADRFVLVTDAIEASGIPKPTVYSWMSRLEVRAACDLQSHRIVVWWPEIRDHMETRRKRNAS